MIMNSVRAILAPLALGLMISACGGSDGGSAGEGVSPSSTVNSNAGTTDMTEIVSMPVSFAVTNVNRSQAQCFTDGAPYTITGRLVGPRAALQQGTTAGAITMYLHSVGWGQFYWHFQEFPQVDYASQMARLGHVSLVYDQLGYGGSGRPSGLMNCYGGEADIANQIVDALRSGGYTVTGATGPAPRFAKVAMASHGVGGLMSQPSAYSFANVDALIVTAWTDFAPAFNPAILLAFGGFSAFCLGGGEMSDGSSGPGYYAFFPLKEQDFAKLALTQMDPVIATAATMRRERASCGEPFSSPPTLASNSLQALLPTVRVPVLLVNGLADGMFMQPLGANAQSMFYNSSPDFTSKLVPGAGHALALGTAAPAFRLIMHNWLAARGF